jgi:hypothetical protein
LYNSIDHGTVVVSLLSLELWDWTIGTAASMNIITVNTYSKRVTCGAIIEPCVYCRIDNDDDTGFICTLLPIRCSMVCFIVVHISLCLI